MSAFTNETPEGSGLMIEPLDAGGWIEEITEFVLEQSLSLQQDNLVQDSVAQT